MTAYAYRHGACWWWIKINAQDEKKNKKIVRISSNNFKMKHRIVFKLRTVAGSELIKTETARFIVGEFMSGWNCYMTPQHTCLCVEVHVNTTALYVLKKRVILVFTLSHVTTVSLAFLYAILCDDIFHHERRFTRLPWFHHNLKVNQWGKLSWWWELLCC